ncbi:SAM dependent carboxyl methyltransferase [Pseudonocardia thermophila]|uniref:SAM dependent carboxyl methyltransferase n=2 Tax=Pseudonocardia thermophila TaxID=1848 RepID=A0A1M6ZNS1_PSETH|nr:SAM dependent carboxyl methyltransferase [Pseudonocardia thermophila]
MLGGGFYSRHSQPQRAAARAADAWLVEAATAVPLPEAPTPLLIGDFGCAGGANEMAPMAAAVDAIRARNGAVPVEVAHTDLPENDFGPLFALLESPDGYPAGRTGVYPYVVGRTLYGPLFPDRRLHLGWSAITLHWLSESPAGVPGRTYPNLMSAEQVEPFRARAEQDWRLFLAERARELVDGGELVIVAGASRPDGTSGAEGLFTMIDEELAALVAAGTLRPQESERIVYPTYNRTPAEWTAPVAECGFDLLATELSHTDDAETYGGTADGAAFAERYLPFVRAVTERPFFRWLDPDRTDQQRTEILEAFYGGLAARIAADPASAACRWHVVSLRLRRKPR